jgi:hypothetical protein
LGRNAGRGSCCKRLLTACSSLATSGALQGSSEGVIGVKGERKSVAEGDCSGSGSSSLPRAASRPARKLKRVQSRGCSSGPLNGRSHGVCKASLGSVGDAGAGGPSCPGAASARLRLGILFARHQHTLDPTSPNALMKPKGKGNGFRSADGAAREQPSFYAAASPLRNSNGAAREQPSFRKRCARTRCRKLKSEEGFHAAEQRTDKQDRGTGFSPK